MQFDQSKEEYVGFNDWLFGAGVHCIPASMLLAAGNPTPEAICQPVTVSVAKTATERNRNKNLRAHST